jgi:hypothetical protein
MLLLSGRVFQVRSRVNRIVDERDGSMTEISSDCVTLEGAVCSGQHSLRRWFCPRAIFPYWREAWLERVDAPGRDAPSRRVIDGDERVETMTSEP